MVDRQQVAASVTQKGSGPGFWKQPKAGREITLQRSKGKWPLGSFEREEPQLNPCRWRVFAVDARQSRCNILQPLYFLRGCWESPQNYIQKGLQPDFAQTFPPPLNALSKPVPFQPLDAAGPRCDAARSGRRPRSISGGSSCWTWSGACCTSRPIRTRRTLLIHLE